MSNLINSIGVLLIIGGLSSFIMGILSHFIPSLHNIFPDDFKKVFSMQYGALIFLTGLVLLYF